MNPPYLGSRKISGTLGSAYMKELKRRYPGEAADLAAYFLRAMHLYYDVAYAAVLATNTISQGATRRTGLAYLLTTPVVAPHDSDDTDRLPWVIRKAVKNVPWPGSVGVTVHSIAMANDCYPCLCPMPFYGIGGPCDIAPVDLSSCTAERLIEAMAREAELSRDSTGVVYTPPAIGMDLVRPVVDLLGPDDVLVDPACGTGALLLYAREAGFSGRMLGFDISDKAVRVAIDIFSGDPNVAINCCDFLTAEG